MLLVPVKYDIYYVRYFNMKNLKSPMWRLKIKYSRAYKEQQQLSTPFMLRINNYFSFSTKYFSFWKNKNIHTVVI